jgi:hypothetical protein
MKEGKTVERNPDADLVKLARKWSDTDLMQTYRDSMAIVDKPEDWTPFVLDVANETIGICINEFRQRGILQR